VSVWSVPRLWPGATIAILASGPSMSQAVADQVHAADLPTIVINNTFRLAPWADMLYAADQEWWSEFPEALHFAGLRVSVSEVKGVHRLRHTGAEGFDPDPTCVKTGGNSGYQALHIAAHAGAKRILLCGFDMHGGHWHKEHQRPLRTTPSPSYGRWIARLATLGEALATRGIEVINCTPGSALRCFRMARLDDCLAAESAIGTRAA